MRGRIGYTVYQFRKSELREQGKLYTHDEVLGIIAKWFAFKHSHVNYALDSNYPWVFRSKLEKRMEVDEYKTLVVPALSLFGPKTAGKLRMIILNDKYACVNEMCKLLVPYRNASLPSSQPASSTSIPELRSTCCCHYIHLQSANVREWIFQNNETELNELLKVLMDHCQGLMRAATVRYSDNRINENNNTNTSDDDVVDGVVVISVGANGGGIGAAEGNSSTTATATTSSTTPAIGEVKSALPLKTNPPHKQSGRKSKWNALPDLIPIKDVFGNRHAAEHPTVDEPPHDVCFTHIPNPFKYSDVQQWIQAQIDRNMHFLRILRTIPMKGNVKFVSFMQGRRSIIRNVVIQKVMGARSQILLRPELKPNEIILPYTWAKYVHLDDEQHVDHSTNNANEDVNSTAGRGRKQQSQRRTKRRMVFVDTESAEPSDPRCFHHLGEKCRLLVKRDPAINGASISAHDTVAFARTDFIMVGSADLENKNADFDGDTESIYFIYDRPSIDEIDMKMLPQNNLRIYQQLRITFTEPHILYMHRRQFSDDAFKHAHLYKSIRTRETYKWLAVSHNRTVLTELQQTYPHVNFYSYVEPTRHILHTTLKVITHMYSSRDGYDFFNFINQTVLHLANNGIHGQASRSPSSPSSIHDSMDDPNLPYDYVMENDLLCDAVLRICFSEARGSIDTLVTLANTLWTNDGTTTIAGSPVAPLDKPKLFDQLAAVNQSMANKSKEVSVNGHNFFKSNIGYDTITFDNNRLCYNGKEIFDSLDFIHEYLLMPPEVANAILYCSNR